MSHVRYFCHSLFLPASSSSFLWMLLWNKGYRFCSIVGIVSATIFSMFLSNRTNDEKRIPTKKNVEFQHRSIQKESVSIQALLASGQLTSFFIHASLPPSLSLLRQFPMTMMIITMQPFSFTTHSIVPFLLILVIIVIISLVKTTKWLVIDQSKRKKSTWPIRLIKSLYISTKKWCQKMLFTSPILWIDASSFGVGCLRLTCIFRFFAKQLREHHCKTRTV